MSLDAACCGVATSDFLLLNAFVLPTLHGPPVSAPAALKARRPTAGSPTVVAA